MKVRMLKTKDASLMLEWMHDDFVVCDMKTNFASKTLEDCISFIKSAQDTKDNLHLAIVNEQDTYMGTVSLKHITNEAAEFGITVRKAAMGKGYAKFGIVTIIKKGFSELGLKKIYWCVSPENHRAVRFYDKNKFDRCSAPVVAKANYTDEEMKYFIWYEVVN